MSLTLDHKSVILTLCAVAFCCWLGKATPWPAKTKPPVARAPELIDERLLLDNPRPLSQYESVPHASRRFDPNVQPASMMTTASLYAIASSVVGQSSSSLVVTEIKQGDLIWPVSAGNTSIQLVTSAPVTVKGKGPADVTVKLGDKEKAVESGEWSIPDVDVNVTSNIQVENKADATLKSNVVTLVRPVSDVRRPRVTQVGNNLHAAPTDFNAASPINVFNRYLRLTGENVPPGTDLEFLVFRDDTGEGKLATVVQVRESKFDPEGTWDVVLRMPLATGTRSQDARDFFVGDTGRLLILGKQGDRHQFASEIVKFKVSSAPRELEKPQFAATAVTKADGDRDEVLTNVGEYFSKQSKVKISGTLKSITGAEDGQIVLVTGTGDSFLGRATKNGSTWAATVSLTNERKHEIRAAWEFGDQILTEKESEPIVLNIRTRGPVVESVQPINFASTPNEYTITVTFDEPLAASVKALENVKAHFLLKHANGTQVAIDETRLPKLSPDGKSAILVFQEFTPDNFNFTVLKEGVDDLFGNKMKEDFSTTLFKPIGGEIAEPSRGISGATGPYVSYGEYTKPRPFIDGFNPSDHVETRVSRLYYFRDAHRVAQIINRDAKSYNRAAVDMQQQLADKARTVADQATDERRVKEREAVRAAEKTREAERELQQAEANAQRAAAEAANANAQLQQSNAVLNNPSRTLTDTEKTQLNNQVAQATAARTSMEEVFRSERRLADAAANKVQDLRAKEAEATERWQGSIAVEDRARENQFRREVAAAQADPDTYAPGKPGSEDPVRQVSVSVIGEGLIQLRGPIKGINIIRTMINQMDAPVGQVRVGVHTVQINGEKGDRMEVVAGKIQRYIDHSRFLTLQSAEMFRKAIVQVAAQRAMELGNVPGLSQEDRDRSYLYAFFGEDFIRELEAMDSEFLGTGNKLLSIHSMDSTSLASAMFIMALAKNRTRMEILQVFEGMMQGELPMAEQNYFEAGLTCDGKDKLFGKYCKPDEFCMLSQNARFQSIRGMFNVEIAEDDTMTPLQREFVRLAQIFKSRLIVEMELKQRVMERSVIEERLGNQEKELTDAREKEEKANNEKRNAQEAVRAAQKGTLGASQQLLSVLQGPKRRADETDAALRDARAAVAGPVDFAGGLIIGQLVTPTRTYLTEEEKRLIFGPLGDQGSVGNRVLDFLGEKIGRNNVETPLALTPTSPRSKKRIFFTIDGDGKIFFRGLNYDTGAIETDTPEKTSEAARAEIARELASLTLNANTIRQQLDTYRLGPEQRNKLREADSLMRRVQNAPGDEIDGVIRVRDVLELYNSIAVDKVNQLTTLYQEMNRINAALGSPDADFQQLHQSWLNLKQRIDAELSPDELAASQQAFDLAAGSFQTLLERVLDYEFAKRNAEESRRPLDHKKFLDMLVDEMEDKYIELLEGTRAHTANIDAYIKRLMTSLDDDFNTQFYYPTFRKVREASQMWDVQMGQVETTTVLANNRAFAKVSPEATMEFDLPKRDIVIAEAMNGAKAMIDDFGALAQDPTFLAMAQLGSGAPTSTQMGGASGGQSTVRNVLPGLSTDTAEAVMGQQGPGGSTFGSAMEALIPDPAIYKFETGTGWEIRPIIQPDGQSLVFHFNYMYTTNVREPVRADEKHLGRVKRHFVDTDVQLSNYELREISRYTVALKASRTSRGVPLFEDIPLVGVLFRPQPSDESSLQQNVIMGQATIFPTVFDLMGLRWAPVVADLDPLRLSNDEFIVRNRRRALTNRVFDHSSSEVDKFLRIPDAERRMDLYRSQETIPSMHPNGYEGPGANLRDSQLQEGYAPTRRPESQFIPSESSEGSPYLRSQRRQSETLYEVPLNQPQAGAEPSDSSSYRHKPASANGVANVEYRSHTGEPRYPGQQAEYITTPPRHEPRPAVRMQRLPTVDGVRRP